MPSELHTSCKCSLRLWLCVLQIVRSAICWLVTDVVGRMQSVKPLYGAPKRYPILAVRGLTGALAMTLYYEALERLPLGDMVSIVLYTCTHMQQHSLVLCLP